MVKREGMDGGWVGSFLYTLSIRVEYYENH